MLMRKTATLASAPAPVAPEPVEMAASDIPAPMTITDEPAVDIPAVPEKTELEEAQAGLGIGGRIEIGEKEFRVVTARPERYGHGPTIEAALYDLKNPGKLQPTVGNP